MLTPQSFSITEVDTSWPQCGHCVYILFEKKVIYVENFRKETE